MAAPVLITATLHVEVQLSNSSAGTPETQAKTRAEVTDLIQSNYDTVHLGRLEDLGHSPNICTIVVADYTGPPEATGYYPIAGTALDVQTYVLRSEDDKGDRRSIKRDGENEGTQARIIALPNVVLNDDWDSLVFDDGLPSRLLRYLVRMVGMMGKPGLNLATFNWNKICLLHGPPGSGKSTLCRALAQKLSIRLGDTFPKATLVEINANALLSKYFGESGKLIESTFDRVQSLARDHVKFVVVVIDEVETIASSRQRVSSSGDCSDGLRATNQLLTALDRLRGLPNILVCCTSNLVEAIDPAFLDRVDIKQHVPSPSSAAVYNIFRSCLNELARSSLLSAGAKGSQGTDTATSSQPVPSQLATSSPSTRKRRRVAADLTPPPTKQPTAYVHIIASPSPTEETLDDEKQEVPTLPATLMAQHQDATSPGQRIWRLAQKCQGFNFSGRTLRRLPVLGLAMYTWGGHIGMDEAIEALEKAVDEEVTAMESRNLKVE